MLADEVDLAGEVIQAMFGDVLSAQNGENATNCALRRTLLNTSQCLAPDVAEVAITAPRPLGNTGVPDIQAGVEGHAVRGRLRPVDGGFALIAHRGRLGLSGKEERMGVWILARGNLVGKEAGEKSNNDACVEIPLSEEAGHTLVQMEHQLVEESHGRSILCAAVAARSPGKLAIDSQR